jgi:PhnB protein
MQAFHPHLIFSGQAEAAFAFYRSVFGGAFSTVSRYADSPFADRVPEAERQLILHIALPLANGTILMGGDTAPSMGHPVRAGTAVQVYIPTESEAETTRLFTALADGGTVTLPVQHTFWGAFFGMCSDRFQVPWMLGYAVPARGRT